jgi:hypothetical protein
MLVSSARRVVHAGHHPLLLQQNATIRDSVHASQLREDAMMLSTLLLMQLCAVGSEKTVAAESVSESREALRLRAGIHLVGGIAVSGFAVGLGPGLSAELGAIAEDRFSLVARLTLATILVTNVATIGLGFDAALSERLSLGVATSIGIVGGLFISDFPFSLTVFAPVRLSFAPFARAATALARRGMLLFVELGPGYALVMSPGLARPATVPSSFSVQGTLGFGYAVW